MCCSKRRSRGKKKFKKKLKLWSLRESEEKEKYAEGVNGKCDGNEDGRALERKLLDVASEACGYTKAKPKHFETWWWSKGVDVAAYGTSEIFRIWKQSWNEEDYRDIVRQKKMPRSNIYDYESKNSGRLLWITLE